MASRIAPPPPKKPPLVDGWYVGDDRRQFPAAPLERLAYYAHLAPSAHNTQPWKFVIGASEIDVFADGTRWLPAADLDRRELHISLGCAIEALRIAADFGGWGSEVGYFPVENDESLVARVRIAMAGPKRDMSASDLLPQIVERQTSHRLFDPQKPVPDGERRRLYTCFQAGDVSLHFLNDRAGIDALAAAGGRADQALFARPGYREELGRYVGEGMLGGSWIASKLGQLAMGHLPVGTQVKHQDSERLASSPLIALLSTRRDSRIDQVQAGEAFMRVALVAQARGIRVQPVSQLLEVPETRRDTAHIFSLGDRTPQHLFRLGYGEAEAHARARRPLREVMIPGGGSVGGHGHGRDSLGPCGRRAALQR